MPVFFSFFLSDLRIPSRSPTVCTGEEAADVIDEHAQGLSRLQDPRQPAAAGGELRRRFLWLCGGRAAETLAEGLGRSCSSLGDWLVKGCSRTMLDRDQLCES